MMSKKLLLNILYFSKYGKSFGRNCFFSTSSCFHEKLAYKVAIIGGGTGGATMAARLRLKIGSENIVVIEPSNLHYYQPYWTLVGGGIKKVKDTCRPMADILPKGVKWIKDSVLFIDPFRCVLESKNGTQIGYDFLIIAMGLNLAFEQIKGLPDAFDTPGVCSNYSVFTVEKTAVALKNFKSGNAVFTQPLNPIKCAGAPQKIMYLAEDYFRKNIKRDQANIQFFTALGTLFSAPKYASALVKVAEEKQIMVNYHHNLVEIKPESKEAIFQKMNVPKDSLETHVVKYEMLHITPPMVAPLLLKESSVADSSGFLDVDKFTLQHKTFQNIFGIGDCTTVPTSKTAAAIAAQSGILEKNILATMSGKTVYAQYNGYTSCPLVTGNQKGILAEFDFDFQALETLPFDQSKERYLHYFFKKDMIPFIYWNLMLKGYWDGPRILRKVLHLGMSR